MHRQTPRNLKQDVELKGGVEFRDASDVAVDDYVSDTPEEKALVRRIDWFLMPSIWLLYLFSYMDRTNIGNAKIAGMDVALGLTDVQYSLAINLFQVAYVIFGVPSNMLLSRVRPSLYIPTIMFLWGAVVACMAAMQKPSHLHALRFLLGMFEAGYSPAVFFMISTWYRRHEQSKRFMIFWTAGILAGAFAGILAGAIASGLDGAHGIAGWRWLFLVEGVLTCGCAFFGPFILLDHPTTHSNKMTAAQRSLAIKRLEADGFNVTGPAEGERRIGQLKALLYAVITPGFWVIFLGFMVVDGSFSIAYFYPSLVEGLGYDSITAQFMTAPLYVVVLPVSIPLSIVADKVPRHRCLILAATLVGGGIFSALNAGITDFVARYVLLCFMNIFLYTNIPLALSFAGTTLAPVEPEIRAIVLAIMSGLGNLAQIYSSYVWPDADAPRYLKGFGTYTGLLCFGAVLYGSAFFIFARWPLKART